MYWTRIQCGSVSGQRSGAVGMSVCMYIRACASPRSQGAFRLSCNRPRGSSDKLGRLAPIPIQSPRSPQRATSLPIAAATWSGNRQAGEAGEAGYADGKVRSPICICLVSLVLTLLRTSVLTSTNGLPFTTRRPRLTSRLWIHERTVRLVSNLQREEPNRT